MPAPKTLLSSFAFAFSVLPAAGLDLDSNGLSDVWEARYHATGLAPEHDTDLDGQTNAAESTAGTDPFDASSHHTSTIDFTGGVLHVTVPTQPGKKYQLTRSTGPDGPWTNEGPALIATTTSHQFAPQQSGPTGFFRVTVDDIDTDSDGLDDWAELQLYGFDKNSGGSFGGATDLATLTAIINVWKTGLTIGTTVGTAYEKELEPAKLTFSRPAGAAYPLTLFLKTSGTTQATKSSASAGDYSLQDATASQPVSNRLVIPAGAVSAVLDIDPVADSQPEVPEQLTFAIGGSPQTASVSICDAENTAANQRLLIAYLRPLPGITSNGSGLATIRLQGDNDASTVTVTFSNLNSPVNSTQVLNASSSILQSVPPAAYTGQQWLIRAGQSFLTDQAVLDSLLGGNIKLGVFTQANVSGEIEGNFQPVTGSTEFQIPPAPAPIATLTGTELERDIARFLTQATFGPTLDSINDLKTRVANAGGDRIAAYEAWIDDQLALPSPSLLAYTTAANAEELVVRGSTFAVNSFNRRRGWWLFSITAQDQLRERFGFALSEIFVISDNDLVVNNRSYGAATYYDMLRNAGNGDYRTLLRNVSISPMMGQYLSHLRNQKATYDAAGNLLVSPDENYAREIMQLFSIGLVQLHPDGSLKLDNTGSPIPTYGQNDITEMARVFTGWSFSKRNSGSTDTVVDNTTFNYGLGNQLYEAQWTNPMKMFADKHDTGFKTTIGLTLPAGQTGEKDLEDVLGHLEVHPNTAPFICRRLIQRLVTANPSAGYLYRVSEVFRNSDGNFPEIIKAILLDPEARSPQSAITLASSGKAKEPIVRATAFLRAFGAKSTMPLSDLLSYGYPQAELDKFPTGTSRYRLNPTTDSLGQSPLGQPNVFNWFLPDYSPPGILSANGLVSPELQLANETSVVNATNFLYNGIYSAGGISTTIGLPATATTNAQRIFPGFVPLENLYMAVVDTNADGAFTSLDTSTFNNVAAISAACEAVLDRIDLLLCAGELKARYGGTAGKPRRIILDAMVSIRSAGNSSNNGPNQKTYMQDRIKTGVWLVMSSPECVTQK